MSSTAAQAQSLDVGAGRRGGHGVSSMMHQAGLAVRGRLDDVASPPP